MACLKTIGHFQVNELMGPFLDELQKLNIQLQEHQQLDEDMDPFGDYVPGHPSFVGGIECQGYTVICSLTGYGHKVNIMKYNLDR